VIKTIQFGRFGPIQINRTSIFIWTVLIILVGVFLRFFLLSRQSLWFDEGYSLDLSNGSFQENLTALLGMNSGDRYQILYYLLLGLWRSLFGSSEFAVRSLSVLLGTATIITVYATAVRLQGERYGLWVTALICCSAFAIFHSQDARPYALLLLIAALQLYFFSAIFEEGQRKFLPSFLFAITSAVGMLGSILIALFTFSLAIAHLLVRRKWKEWFFWWIPTGILCAPIVLFYGMSPATTDPTETVVTRAGLPIILNAAFAIYGTLVGMTYGPPLEELRDANKFRVLMAYAPHFLLLFLVVASILFLLVKRTLNTNSNRLDSRSKLIFHFFVILFSISFLMAFALAYVTKLNWSPRHSFYLFFPIIFLLPFTLEGITCSEEGANHSFSSPSAKSYSFWKDFPKITLIFFLLLNGFSLYNYYFNIHHVKDDYRSAARYLVENRSGSEKSVMLWGATSLLEYYGDKDTISALELTRKNIASRLGSFTNNSPVVYLVINREFYWDPENRNISVEAAMDQNYQLTSKTFFPYFGIYRFVRK